MYTKRRINISAGILIVATVLFLSACVSQRSVEYLQDKSKTTRSFDEAKLEDYRLKPNDELYIQISSLDDAAANVFSAASTSLLMNSGTIQPYGASLISYTVDKDGYVLLPVVGRISVQNKTTGQVSETIKESLTNVLSQPVVTVKMVNRYVTVLGEVRNPGHFAYSQDKLSVLDAIGLAGDITDYGDRNDVVLTRNENGKNIRIIVDLTTSGILSSEYYYIRPNDIIYIRPLQRKIWGMKEFPFDILLSSISTAILIYTVFK